MGHEKLGKVMESHRILKASKSTNPVTALIMRAKKAAFPNYYSLLFTSISTSYSYSCLQRLIMVIEHDFIGKIMISLACNSHGHLMLLFSTEYKNSEDKKA